MRRLLQNFEKRLRSEDNFRVLDLIFIFILFLIQRNQKIFIQTLQLSTAVYLNTIQLLALTSILIISKLYSKPCVLRQ